MNKAIIFSAPSGSGKTTIVHKLIERGLPLGFSISATSRPCRSGEQNKKDYFFLSIKDFREKIHKNHFLEWEEVYENILYGTLKSETQRLWDKGKAVIFDVDVKGAIRLKEILKHNALSLFIKTPSLDVLEKRLRERKTENEASVKKRLDRANFEISFENKFDYCIINDNLEKAIDEAEKIILHFLQQ